MLVTSGSNSHAKVKTMSNPLPGIITRITEIMGNRSLTRKDRDVALNAAADEAWSALFPEDAQPSNRLTPEARMNRWNSVRQQLSGNPNCDKILRIIESTASGESFHWLE
jgi:hypothetical protein